MKSDRVFWIVGLLAFLLLFSATSQQAVAGTTGKIKGQIVDSNGQALPGANVIIEGTSPGYHNRGRWRLPDLAGESGDLHADGIHDRLRPDFQDGRPGHR